MIIKDMYNCKCIYWFLCMNAKLNLMHSMEQINCYFVMTSALNYLVIFIIVVTKICQSENRNEYYRLSLWYLGCEMYGYGFGYWPLNSASFPMIFHSPSKLHDVTTPKTIWTQVGFLTPHFLTLFALITLTNLHHFLIYDLRLNALSLAVMLRLYFWWEHHIWFMAFLYVHFSRNTTRA